MAVLCISPQYRKSRDVASVFECAPVSIIVPVLLEGTSTRLHVRNMKSGDARRGKYLLKAELQ